MPQVQVLPGIPGFGEEFGRGLGTGISQGLSKSLEDFHKRRQLQLEEKKFQKMGYPEDLAKLAASATTGGQTEVLKQLLEQRQRGMFPQQQMQSQNEPQFEQQLQEEVGLTPKERISREEGRYKAQLPKYDALENKSFGLDQEHMRLQRLQELNESDALPTGLGRINVDFKEGGLRAPFVSSPEAQEFVKIVNDFLSSAKDTFGARVTNFEVSSFMRRLPSLLNTQEGRRNILRQMEILNEINRIHTQGTLDEFDKRGGVRKIDFDTAEKIARTKTKDEINRLKKEYIQGERKTEKEMNEGKEVFMRDPSGNLRKVPKNQVKEAAKAGYKLEK